MRNKGRVDLATRASEVVDMFDAEVGLCFQLKETPGWIHDHVFPVASPSTAVFGTVSKQDSCTLP